MDVYIHLGIHKTASTYLQNYYFEKSKYEIGYIHLRKELNEFLQYILHTNELEYSTEKARSIFDDLLKNISFNKRITISDEQFCGSPWDNASMRKQYFDRLNSVFPSARYIILFREQESLVQSLYLQYIKTGGSCSPVEFLKSNKHPLQFSLKSYLNFGDYYNYMVSQVGASRIHVFYYEEMKMDPVNFYEKIESVFDINNQSIVINTKILNRSVKGLNALVLRQINKVVSSHRNPYLIFPSFFHKTITRLLINKVQIGSKNLIPESVLKDFCQEVKVKNYKLPFSQLTKKYGYINQ